MIRAEFDLSGFAVSLSCDVPAIVHEFERVWAPFRTSSPPARRLLDVVITEAKGDSLRSGPIPKDIACRVENGVLEVRSGDALARAGSDGSCTIAVASGRPQAQLYAITNVLLAVVAWRLPAEGALLVHAAGLVVDGRAFILLGGEAAGKTTWAEGGKAEGAGFLSDDVIALHAAESGVTAMSFPFRANHPAPLPPARWPLVAVLLPKWGDKATIETASAIRAHTALEASVLYRDVLARDPAVPRVIDAIAAVPALVLVFAADGRTAPVLRAL